MMRVERTRTRETGEQKMTLPAATKPTTAGVGRPCADEMVERAFWQSVTTLPAALQHSAVAFAQFLAYAKVSYCATLLIAVPAHFLLRKRHWTSLSIYVLIGGAMGLAVYLFHLMFGVPFHAPGLGPVARTLISLPVDTVGGVIVLICFWLIARPDRE